MFRALSVALLLVPALSFAQARSAAPAGAEVYILSPAEGAKVSNPVTIKFGLKGMGVSPAGVKFDGAGHHHLLIDTDAPANPALPLPTVENKVVHFGKGQTEASITLPPGKHTLQLVLGDYLHIPHNPPVMSKKVTIEVTK
ncbi:MAG TPA: DUF4399 domain-containing protein [Steroidobacteraceae bacterium]|nr:DUF4399 domain-containing protein [Steroidobacteraceae bacterium]